MKKFRAAEMAKTAIFKFLNSLKLIARKNLSDRKFPEISTLCDCILHTLFSQKPLSLLNVHNWQF